MTHFPLMNCQILNRYIIERPSCRVEQACKEGRVRLAGSHEYRKIGTDIRILKSQKIGKRFIGPEMQGGTRQFQGR